MSKYFGFFLVFFLTSCLFSQKITLKGNGNIRLTQIDFEQLNGWNDGDHKSALRAFLHSCRKFAKMADETSISGQLVQIKVKDFRDVCDIGEVIKTMNSQQAKNFFENWFKPFKVSNRKGNSQGLFTGYYEASLNGSKTKSEKYKYPIYSKPDNLTSDPYLTRSEIENGALNNKGLELLYVDDKTDLFFMHIQGSGRITLEDGSEIRVGFAAKNNQPFIAISSYMADNGLIDPNNVNAATIKEWLKANPERQDEVMNINSSFIFFHIIDQENVIGAQGVPLTPRHSLAIDHNMIPYGVPLWVETSLKDKNKNKTPFSDLFIAQDTGSAIKGAVRGDIFFGRGQENEEKAYYMASSGTYSVLLPNSVVDAIK